MLCFFVRGCRGIERRVGRRVLLGCQGGLVFNAVVCGAFQLTGKKHGRRKLPPFVNRTTSPLSVFTISQQGENLTSCCFCRSALLQCFTLKLSLVFITSDLMNARPLRPSAVLVFLGSASYCGVLVRQQRIAAAEFAGRWQRGRGALPADPIATLLCGRSNPAGATCLARKQNQLFSDNVFFC